LFGLQHSVSNAASDRLCANHTITFSF
jgi:hypothetical protein